MVAANADDYAAQRVNIFFPANNSTPADGNLTGQCVTLCKWFFAEMCNNFPNPFAARGDARYVGKNLVAQGLATEVPYAERRRGDIICLEYGVYGHIYVQLSGGRRFEENANVGGAARRVLADGTIVYASRIGSDSEAWLAGLNPHCYRLKSYVEQGGDEPMINNVDNEYWRWNKLFKQIRGRSASRDEFVNFAVGKTWLNAMELLSDSSEADQATNDGDLGALARRDNWQGQIYTLQDQVKAAVVAANQAQADLTLARQQLQDIGTRPTQAQLDALTKQLQDAEADATKKQAALAAATEALEKAKAESAADQATGNAFLRWLGDQLNKILGKG